MQTVGLSNVQKELLKLYANDVSEESLLEIKQILAKYFAEKATSAMDEFWDENGLNEQTMIDWTNGHDRAQSRNLYYLKLKEFEEKYKEKLTK